MVGLEATGVAVIPRRGRLADLYQQHAADAVRLAYLLTGDKHLAEDLVQDAFVRLFGRFQDLRKPDAFAFYLRRTVVNLSKDHFRRLQRDRALSRRLGKAAAEDDGTLARLFTHDELFRALQRLSPRQRAAVVLRFCEGLTEHETAEVMGTTAGAINSLVSRGLGTLRGSMRGEEHD